MQIEIISIGDEVLQGLIVNSNAAFLSKELVQQGWKISRQTTLPDEEQALEEGLRESLNRSSCVITTGGLGPTCDDLTRDIAARLFDSAFHFDEEIAADLTRRYGNMLISLENQATLPNKAKPLMNRFGTAPGLIFQEKGKTLILLPGVPPEMRPMFTDQVIPFLKRQFPINSGMLQKSIHLCLLSETSVDPTLREIKQKIPKINIGIYPGYGVLTVVFSSINPTSLHDATRLITDAFPKNIFSSTTGKIEEVLYSEMTNRKKTLALAESMTGGKIAAQITAIPGASEFFLGSIIAYSNGWKKKLLSVKEETLREAGAVSEAVVKEMLEGLFELSNADYGIAVSGIAGPTGGTAEKPVGTVWAAIGERGHIPDIVLLQSRGSRETNILLTTNRLLGGLWRKIVYGEKFSA